VPGVVLGNAAVAAAAILQLMHVAGKVHLSKATAEQQSATTLLLDILQPAACCIGAGHWVCCIKKWVAISLLA
jgi:hypothetical protein